MFGDARGRAQASAVARPAYAGSAARTRFFRARNRSNGGAGSRSDFKCIGLNCGGGEVLPARGTGGLYKTNGSCALRFCRGLSVSFTVNALGEPRTSGQRVYVSGQIGSL